MAATDLVKVQKVYTDPDTSVTTLGLEERQTVSQVFAGAPATLTAQGTVLKAAAQTDFVGADVTALKVELNAFLDKLQAAGIIG